MKKNGFTLIELMIAITIMGILMVIAIPHFSSWILNSRIRNTAEGINAAIIKSKSASIISMSNQISFTLNADTSWLIKNEKLNVTIANKTASESSKGVSISIFPATSSMLTFNSYGAIVANVDGSPSITMIDVTSINPTDGITPLRIMIGKGGATVICSNPPIANSANPTDCSNVVLTDYGV